MKKQFLNHCRELGLDIGRSRGDSAGAFLDPKDQESPPLYFSFREGSILVYVTWKRRKDSPSETFITMHEFLKLTKESISYSVDLINGAFEEHQMAEDELSMIYVHAQKNLLSVLRQS